jgi:hypothetical protein
MARRLSPHEQEVPPPPVVVEKAAIERAPSGPPTQGLTDGDRASRRSCGTQNPMSLLPPLHSLVLRYLPSLRELA